MTSIMIQLCKYVLIVFMLSYLFSTFYAFRMTERSKNTRILYAVQKGFIYIIHFLGFFCLYLKEPSVELAGFYVMQVVCFTMIFVFYHLIYKKCSVPLLNNMTMLLVIGMIMLTRINFDKAFRQFVFLMVGAIAMLILPMFLQKGSRFRKLSAVYCVVGLVLLGTVVLIGSTSYGAKLNLTIGGISFQPSEFVKLIFVFFIASMLYKRQSLKQVLLTSCLSALFVLCLVASKDLGGALLYFMAYMIMVYAATRQKRYLVGGAAGMTLAAVAGYFLFSHVRVRVFAWLDPLADIDRRGYQICQSLFGIGTGGWFGLGIGEGLPNKIPVVDKDFIFAAISEEFGGIFAIGVIVLCIICFMLMMNIAMQMKDNFYKLTAVGLGALYATQTILTIGGAIKFIPSTGVTLPLVSYGGSSLLSTLFMFGILQGLYMYHATKPSERRVETSKTSNKTGRKNAQMTGGRKPENQTTRTGGSGKEFAVVFYIFTTIFVAMIVYFTYFLAFESEDFIKNDYNKLQTLFEEDVTRGDIITSDGYVIAETVEKDGEEVRHYPYGEMFAHVGGYSGNTKTGLEKLLNFSLLRSHSDFVEQLMCELSGQKKTGDNAVVSLRYDLQEAAYKALGKYDGAVVAMDPATGEILAMVSKPDFDPNTIMEDWEDLQEGSALYNRASQGQYTPGSIFKIITTLAYMRSNPDSYADYHYTCTGEITMGGKTIHCAGNKKHGELDLQGAFAQSCNTAFVNMLEDIDIEILNDICDDLLFNQDLPVVLESSKSSFGLDVDASTALKMDTLIGQGETLVSPLHMAMLVSAICNDGVAMRPTFMEEIQTEDGYVVEKEEAKQYATLFTAEEVEVLSAYMRSTVEDGTASRLGGKEYEAFGKTGTAQTSSDLDVTDAWFVGYAKLDGREIAIAVVVEDSGSGSKYALPIAEKVSDAFFQ